MASKAAAYRNLHLMLQAGLPAVQAFRTVGKSTGSVGRAMREMSDQLREGSSIAEAMGTHRSVFGLLDEVVVGAGEESGDLPGSFAMLAQWYEFRQRLINQIRSGMLLPLIVINMIALLLPLISVCSDAVGGGDIRFERIPLMAMRNLLLIWVPIVGILAILRLAPDRGWLRRGFDYVLLGIPLLGGALRELALSRYFWAYYVLSKAGVDAIRASRMSAQVAGNSAVAADLEAGTRSAAMGNPITEGLAGKMPREYVDILQVGEQTGEMDESARRLAEIASERASTRLHAMATWTPRVAYLAVLLYGAMKVVQSYTNLLDSMMSGM